MTDYKQGTVAEIGWPMTSRRERAFFDGYSWLTETGVRVGNPTNVRTLVVLDLDPTIVTEKLGAQRNEPQRLVNMLRETADSFFTPDAAALARRVADQIQAQTKPPRIPEPGLWGVVEATVAGIPRRRWVHHEEDRWVSDNGIPLKAWDELIDPVLVREGVDG